MMQHVYGASRRLFAGTAMVAALMSVGPEISQAEGPVKVPGTSVTMTPPSTFVLSTDFAGFSSEEAQGSFLIAEFPAAAQGDLEALFDDEDRAKADFAKNGVIIESREELETASGATVPVLRGSQEANGFNLEKWMVLYSGEKTVMITFQIPKEKSLGEDVMRLAFASVTTGSALTIDNEVANLPFEIEATPPFRIVKTLGGMGVMMMVGDKDEDPEGKQPLLITVHMPAQTSGENLAGTAEATLKASKEFLNIAVATREDTTFAATDGVVLRGTAERHGMKMRFTQYFTISEGRMLQVLAMVPEADYEGLSQKIDEIAESVRFKD